MSYLNQTITTQFIDIRNTQKTKIIIPERFFQISASGRLIWQFLTSNSYSAPRKPPAGRFLSQKSPRNDYQGGTIIWVSGVVVSSVRISGLQCQDQQSPLLGLEQNCTLYFLSKTWSKIWSKIWPKICPKFWSKLWSKIWSKFWSKLWTIQDYIGL